ncbi:hypothetical protein [Mycobacterium avium]|uniref:hypothetical protein n=1 Tax=Mycobacterium avium TaxID=1764 RepID=UPI0015941807|nr:hypothetical protein [Mycobacterium avium]
MLRLTAARMLAQTTHHRPGSLLQTLQRLLRGRRQAAEQATQPTDNATDKARDDF